MFFYYESSLSIVVRIVIVNAISALHGTYRLSSSITLDSRSFCVLLLPLLLGCIYLRRWNRLDFTMHKQHTVRMAAMLCPYECVFILFFFLRRPCALWIYLPHFLVHLTKSTRCGAFTLLWCSQHFFCIASHCVRTPCGKLVHQHHNNFAIWIFNI